MTITVVGESLVDLVWHSDASAPVPAAGGSPANVAIGLRRLGVDNHLVTCWGDNKPGELVAAHLAGAGLDVVRVRSTSGRTTIALAYIDEASKAATYDFVMGWDPASIEVPADTVLLHTGSLAVVAQPGADRVLDACRGFRSRQAGLIAVDLNVRPSVEPDRGRYLAAVEKVLAVADIVKASDEDLAWLWPERTPLESARAVLGHGPRLVALTLGDEGAIGCMSDLEVRVAAPAVDVVDTIGAGDSFHAALLSGLMSSAGRTRSVALPSDETGLRAVLARAVAAGALACSRAGAQPPTLAELDRAMRV